MPCRPLLYFTRHTIVPSPGHFTSVTVTVCPDTDPATVDCGLWTGPRHILCIAWRISTAVLWGEWITFYSSIVMRINPFRFQRKDQYIQQFLGRWISFYSNTYYFLKLFCQVSESLSTLVLLRGRRLFYMDH